ncbi:proprotein convertase subtilisin/kexin type 5 [Microdochium nivale]|nr:proprotein convertase subtilisin/kexin type 5 [Microdochium nivale]
MASDHIQLHTRAQQESLHQHDPALLTLLANSLVLHQIVPYLPVSSLLRLASTSSSFRSLVHQSHGVFRHLDLATVKRAQPCVDNSSPTTAPRRETPDVHHDRFAVEPTEDDIYSAPLRGVLATLRQRDILGNVQTLVLDGLSVTAELLNDMLIDPSIPVRILSVRGCVNLNEAKLMQTLRFAYRRGRAPDSPRLKGLYIFGSKDDLFEIEGAPRARSSRANSMTGSAGLARSDRSGSSSSNSVSIAWNPMSQSSSDNAVAAVDGDDWYHTHGRIISRKIADGWAETLLDCRDSLRFDAVLCTGPRHQNSPAFGRVPVSSYSSQARATPWAVATFAVGGCAVCGTAPEGFTVHGESPEEQLPLLAPLLVHSSNVKTACRPGGASSESSRGSQPPRFVPRCLECIRERYCFSCDQWWCESCYQVPGQHQVVTAPLPQAQAQSSSSTLTSSQQAHVHAVDQPGDLLAHELAAIAQPKLQHQPLQARKIQRSCWECDPNCDDCVTHTSRTCKSCGGGYCLVHYDGATETHCDWCSSRRGSR